MLQALMAAISKWLLKLGDSTNRTVEVIELSFAGTIILSWMWLTKDLNEYGITTEWNVAFASLLGAVAITKVNNVWVNKNAKTETPDAPKQPEGEQK